MASATDCAPIAVPPPLIFLGYLISAFVLQWAVPFRTPWPVAPRILGGLLVIAGLLLAVSAVRELRRMHAAPDAHQPVAALVTTGPYRLTRNPIYLGFLLIYLGFTLLGGTLWGLLLTPFLIGTVTHWVIHVEETYLLDRFPEEYGPYAKRVRRWL